jgi:transcriptional antiterminator RfaH
MEKWCVAHSKPRSEELLWTQYHIRGLEAYYPCLKAHTVNPRAKQTRPYFPGYLFVHVDLAITGRSALDWLPGGNGLVCFDDEPATVSESLILAIRQRLDGLAQPDDVMVPPRLRQGERILIHAGIFSGYEGIFDLYLSGAERARVLLSLLGDHQVAVDLSADSLRRLA